MKFMLNNREEEFPGDSISIGEMLIRNKFSFPMKIIKINGILIPKDKYDFTMINNGDDVQMVYLMSGG